MAPRGPEAAVDARVTTLEETLRREQKKLLLVQDIGQALSSGLGLDRLLVLIMDKVTQLMNADRSTLYLLSEDRLELWSKVVQGDALFEIRLKVGEGVAGWVAGSGQVVNIADAYSDTRFQPAVDLRSGYRTRTILCVPARGRDGNVVGVLQCLNKAEGAFTGADEELLTALAGQAAIAIENARLYHALLAQNVELRHAKQALEQKSRELNALYEVEKELSATAELDSLLPRILAQAVIVLGGSAGVIALCEPDGKSLRFRFVVGQGSDELADKRIALGEGLIGRAVARREAVATDPRVAPPAVAELASLGGPPRHVMAAPLSDGDELFGAIEIIEKVDGGEGFDEIDCRVLVLIAGQVAKAIGLTRSRSEQSNRDRLASIGRMVAGILHDLKTPMTIISGYAQLMAQAGDVDKREQYVEQIQRQFAIMSGMTREVLAFARGDADIVIRKVYLHKFLEEVAEQLGHALAGRQVDVVIDAGYDGTAHFDEQKMMRVIHNLARNAADAMPDGGTFRVATSVEGNAWLVVELADNGPGIPPEIQGKLFELFASAKKGGTGLGLAIVKKIVDEHGGTIDWSSGEAGTSFRVRLPLRRGDGPLPTT